MSPQKALEEDFYSDFIEKIYLKVDPDFISYRIFETKILGRSVELVPSFFQVILRRYFFERATHRLLNAEFYKEDPSLQALLNEWWTKKRPEEEAKINALVYQLSPIFWDAVQEVIHPESESFPLQPLSDYFRIELGSLCDILKPQVELPRETILQIATLMDSLERKGVSRPIRLLAAQFQALDLDHRGKQVLYKFLLDVQENRMKKALEQIQLKYGQLPPSTDLAPQSQEVFEKGFLPLYADYKKILWDFYLPLIPEDTREDQYFDRSSVFFRDVLSIAMVTPQERWTPYHEKIFEIQNQWYAHFLDLETQAETDNSRKLLKLLSDRAHVPSFCVGLITLNSTNLLGKNIPVGVIPTKGSPGEKPKARVHVLIDQKNFN